MLNAIGAGLIGWGAILLATTLAAPIATSSIAEFERTSRNVRVATALSILSTAAGAVLLLVNHEWFYALIGLAVGATVFYAVQVTLTWHAWRALAAQVDLERSQLDDRVTIETAGRIGLLPASVSVPFAVPLTPAVEGSGERAHAITVERARLWWALRHPRGGRTLTDA